MASGSEPEIFFVRFHPNTH